MMQDNLIIYNGYHPELFHHDLSIGEVKAIETLTVESFENQKNRYFNLTNKLADRFLVNIKNNSFVVTAEPVNQYILEEIVKIYELDIGSMHFEHLLSDHPEDLAITILRNGKLMDKLRKWAREASNPILNPRTISVGSIQLAQELKINHSLIMPPSLKKIVKGIYPSMDYMKKHGIKENNSKVRNYLLLKELEKNEEYKFAPVGDVAFDLDKICDIVCKLAKRGKKAIIKADLSMSGAGNIVLDTLKKRRGRCFLDLSCQQQKNKILKLLREKTIPLSRKTGVVVNEYYENILFDPSYEIYSYPQQWNIRPRITYACGMLINNGGFDGCYIPDPLESKNLQKKNDTTFKKYDISLLLLKIKKEYKSLTQKLKLIIINFIERKWKKGYVGMCDCDIGILIDKREKLTAKIFEFNYSRENGGTYPYIFFRKLINSNFIKSNSTIISRDKLRGPLCNLTTKKIIQLMKEKKINLQRKKGGCILIGHKSYEEDCHLSCFSIAPNFQEAIEFDSRLLNLINFKDI